MYEVQYLVQILSRHINCRTERKCLLQDNGVCLWYYWNKVFRSLAVINWLQSIRICPTYNSHDLWKVFGQDNYNTWTMNIYNCVTAVSLCENVDISPTFWINFLFISEEYCALFSHAWRIRVYAIMIVEWQTHLTILYPSVSDFHTTFLGPDWIM